MASHPIQCILTTASGALLTASHSTITCLAPSSSSPTTSTPHSGLIRILVAHSTSCPSTSTSESTPAAKEVVISTGEDKFLIVSELPSLAVLSKRELIKRANTLVVDPKDGTIVVGDKFGDVYTYPLIPAPLSAEEEEAAASSSEGAKGAAEPKKLLPILGHVSMLNTLCLVPSTESAPALVVTGDRDEHIRVSRYPRGHNIERFLWGSKKFVSALYHLPASTPSQPPLIFSAGGDPTLNSFNLSTGELLSSFNIEDILLPHVSVAPSPPVKVMRRKDRRLAEVEAREKNANGKGKEKEVVEPVEGDAEVEKVAEEDAAEAIEIEGESEGEPEEMEAEEEGEAEVEELVGKSEAAALGLKVRTLGPHAWKDGVTTALAISKIDWIGSKDRTSSDVGGLVVAAAGCDTLLYLPYSLLLNQAPSSPANPEKISLSHPILDFTISPSATSTTLWVTLDISRSENATGSSKTAIRKLVLSPEGLFSEVEPSEAATILSASGVPVTDKIPLPEISSLYPLLSLIHHEPDEADAADDNDTALPPDESEPSAGAKGGKKNKKRGRGGESSPKVEDKGVKRMKQGKRAEGRQKHQMTMEKKEKILGTTAGTGGAEKEEKAE